jgi:hypothetical protein
MEVELLCILLKLKQALKLLPVILAIKPTV